MNSEIDINLFVFLQKVIILCSILVNKHMNEK